MLELRHITKHYDERVVVDSLSLSIDRGQIVSLLGPSGSGKSTVLRLVAGLVRPDAGTIQLAGEVVFGEGRDVPPEQRAIGMVFQDYALWPHMTVAQNIAFGLRLQHWPRQRIRTRVGELLDLVRLTGLEDRYPFQLSGGQQQRVALARALATEPRLLLLDEPLSSLDSQLRQSLREELVVILRQVEITSLYVTHDYTEALEISDVVVVLRDGQLEQMGSPVQLYQEPRSLFVARFLGATNTLVGPMEAIEADGTTLVGVHAADTWLQGQPAGQLGPWGVLCIWPEAVEVLPMAAGRTNVVIGTLLHSGFLGSRWHHLCVLSNGTHLRFATSGPLDAAVGSTIRLYLPPNRCRIFEAEGELLPMAATGAATGVP